MSNLTITLDENVSVRQVGKSSLLQIGHVHCFIPSRCYIGFLAGDENPKIKVWTGFKFNVRSDDRLEPKDKEFIDKEFAEEFGFDFEEDDD